MKNVGKKWYPYKKGYLQKTWSSYDSILFIAQTKHSNPLVKAALSFSIKVDTRPSPENKYSSALILSRSTFKSVRNKYIL